jgi:cell pole-organizing protein PopZ
VAASAPDPEPEPGPDLWSAPVATAPAAETDVAPDPEACAEPERETAVEARSAQPVAPGSGTDFAPEPSPRRPARAAPLVSPQTDQNVQAAFSRLTSTMMAQNSRTLEDLVGDMLRPMLKTWLDDNLPSIVERLVRAEIERVARGGR